MALKGQKMSAAEKRAKTKYNAKPAQKAKRAKRGRDRYQAEKEGRVKKGDGKDLDHYMGNARGPTRVRSASANRKDNRRGPASKRKTTSKRR